jgi:flagellar motor switch protein FliN/FliY
MSPNEDRDLSSVGASVALGADESAEVAQQKEPDEEREASRTVKDGGDTVKKAEFQPVTESGQMGKPTGIELLFDVVVPVAIELGRTSMQIKNILELCQGSVIELERAAGEPVDILVSGKPLGRGEVVVLNDRFGVRITEFVNPFESVTKA